MFQVPLALGLSVKMNGTSSLPRPGGTDDALCALGHGLQFDSACTFSRGNETALTPLVCAHHVDDARGVAQLRQQQRESRTATESRDAHRNVKWDRHCQERHHCQHDRVHLDRAVGGLHFSGSRVSAPSGSGVRFTCTSLHIHETFCDCCCSRRASRKRLP